MEPSQKLSSFIHKPRRESHRRLPSSPQTLPEESCSFPFFVFVPRRVYIWTRHYILIVLLITIEINIAAAALADAGFFIMSNGGNLAWKHVGVQKKAHHLSK